MSDDDRKQRATSFIATIRSGDEQAFHAIMTDDVVWSLPGTSKVSGVAQGISGVFKRVQGLREYGVTLEIQDVLLRYEGAALLLHNTGSRNGVVLDEHLTTVLAFRGGKISRLDTYISDIPMVNAYFS